MKVNKDKKKFCKNLKMAKIKQEISYTDIAKKLKVSESMISYYQNRTDNNFVEFLFLLKKLGVDMNDLFT
jgi:transcriptional regulator with XRE-family HTH domain